MWRTFLTRIVSDLSRNRHIYIMSIPMVIFYILFHYVPMYGAVIAFKHYSPGLGIASSPWVGFANFLDFFENIYFYRLVRNTLLINVKLLLFGFPIPIIFAILINEIRVTSFRRTIQTISYLPHFISTMVVCGMIIDFTRRDGFITQILSIFGSPQSNLLLQAENFHAIYVVSDIWQGMGWNSIIYIAAITAIDPQLYEAAEIDGAKRFRKMVHVTLPGIIQTIIILLILRVGQIMSLGFEKIILLYNANTYETADVISSYVYRKGLIDFNYSYSTAVGLFNSIINFSFLLFANSLSRQLNETSLW